MFVADKVFEDRIPSVVYIGVLLTPAYNGSWRHNPFAFRRNHGQAWSIVTVRQFVKGEEYPFREEVLNAQNGIVDLKGYRKLCSTFGCYSGHHATVVQPKEWGYDKHCTLFCFNNNPDGNPHRTSHKTPFQQGETRYEITFSAVPNENLTIMFAAERDVDLQIDAMGVTHYEVAPY